jgi:uncharacterized protein (DUF2252 family)
MRSCTSVVESDLSDKHAQMKEDLFMFFRGTYYRWAQLWPETCSELNGAPKVLAVGDLHVGSFGTWRDAEGRLCWGVDDFDESYPLPYTNDLVRLAASAKITIDAGALDLKFKGACNAILDGYRESLQNRGCPFVPAEEETNLEKLGIDAIRAGLGSLGQLRFVAIGKWQGGFIAREAKAVVPSASVWIRGKVANCQSYYERAIRSSVRSRDPCQRIVGTWLIRRLSPDSNPIDIDDLPKERDEETLLKAMGSEAANVHLGSEPHGTRILKDLRRRNPDWLRNAAKVMAKAVEREWKEYQGS